MSTPGFLKGESTNYESPAKDDFWCLLNSQFPGSYKMTPNQTLRAGRGPGSVFHSSPEVFTHIQCRETHSAPLPSTQTCHTVPGIFLQNVSPPLGCLPQQHFVLHPPPQLLGLTALLPWACSEMTCPQTSVIEKTGINSPNN